MTVHTPPRQPFIAIPESRRGKILFAIGLILWFTFISIPCGMFWFASGNEIRLAHGAVPESYEHPLIEIGLIMTTENRGFKFKSSEIIEQDKNAVCVQTNLNYLLWSTREKNPSTSFCNCYERGDTESVWKNISTTDGDCLR